jgi:hypothetical protein
LASRASKVSVKLGGGWGVDGGTGGDVVLVGRGDVVGVGVGGGGVSVDGGAEGRVGVDFSMGRAEGIKVCPVVGATLGAMVGSPGCPGCPGSSGRSGCGTVGAQVGVAVGGDVASGGIGR